MTSGALYLVPATLEDVRQGASQQRAAAHLPQATREVIGRLRDFAVEDAKSARAFLKAVGCETPIRDLNLLEIGHQPDAASLESCRAVLTAGRDLGLLSECGCPGVADPGAQVARLAHDLGCRVVPLIGPSSLLLALMASGLEGQRFAFSGYLPVPPAERARAIADLEARSRKQDETQVVIETPYRNRALFDALTTSLDGTTLLSVAVDLTLDTESVRTATVAAWRKLPLPAFDKRPAVFLLLAARGQGPRPRDGPPRPNPPGRESRGGGTRTRPPQPTR